MKRGVVVALSALLVLSLALAGCGQRVTAEDIVAHLQATLDSTKDAHAVVTGSAFGQGLDLSATVEVWEKAPNKVRAQVLETSRAELEGALIVSDGQQAWAYEPSRNVVMAGAMGDMDLPLPQELLTSMQDVIQAVLDASNVELVGEETVLGHEAYKLTLSPKDDAAQWVLPGGGTATLWVDKAEWFPLKATYEAGDFGQASVEVTDFELNPGLDKSLFRFKAPEGAQVVDVTAQEPQALTLAEAMAEAPFPLLAPGYVPDGATLIEVLQVGESYVLRYDHSPDVSFTVIQGPELPMAVPMGEAQGITIGGQEATAISDEGAGSTFLYWTKGGVTVAVAGHISLDEALKVAESLQ